MKSLYVELGELEIGLDELIDDCILDMGYSPLLEKIREHGSRNDLLHLDRVIKAELWDWCNG